MGNQKQLDLHADHPDLPDLEFWPEFDADLMQQEWLDSNPVGFPQLPQSAHAPADSAALQAPALPGVAGHPANAALLHQAHLSGLLPGPDPLPQPLQPVQLAQLQHLHPLPGGGDLVSLERWMEVVPH